MKILSPFVQRINMKKELYDTIIVGGGTAGSIAGIQAARDGNSVLIVEKSINLGGAAVNALVNPMMESFVKHESIFYEIEERLKKKGKTTRDGIMEYVYASCEDKALVLEEMFLESGGEVLYDVTLSGCEVNNNKINSIKVIGVEGEITLRAKQFIDATGDALLSRMSGVECESGDESGNNQMSSLRFEMGGIDVDKYRDYCLSLNDEFSPLKQGFFFESAMVKNKNFKLEPKFREGIEKGILKEEDLTYYQCFSIPNQEGVMSFNCPHVSSLKKNTNSFDRSAAICEGRQMIQRLVSFLKECMPGFEKAYLIRQASALGVRESYRIKGIYTLCEDDYINRRKFTNAVAKGDWYIDVHSATKGLVHMEKYQKGEYYEIPYTCLVNKKISNILTIGRCISTTFLTQASIRIQPTVIDMGQSAGKACAIALKKGVELNAFDGNGLING